jgi:cysteine-rich repeat protein
MPDAASGVYTILNPEGGDNLVVRCDMTSEDGGWTLVYKIADASDMLSDGAVNAAGLAQSDGDLDTSGVGKLSDNAIRALCGGQFKVMQMGASVNGRHALYCEFDDVMMYADSAQYAGKDCSETFNPVGDYPDKPINGHWSTGFSTWDIPGGTILQLNAVDDRLGSKGCKGCGQTDAGCSGQGGCHSQVWCLSDSHQNCGNGVIDAENEGCDDQNRVSGDGCNAFCGAESGWDCTDAETACMYADGPVASNGGYICHEPYGLLDDAISRCNVDATCTHLHDQNNDGNDWRACSLITEQVNGPASTKVKSCSSAHVWPCHTQK